MTLRTIENEFSDELLKQTSEESKLDLTLEGPLLSKLPPKIIWARLQHKYDPTLTPQDMTISGYHFDCFKNVSEAKNKYPEVSLEFVGKPWLVGQFRESTEDKAIIDFASLGAVLLSKSEIQSNKTNDLWWHELPLWLSYALSPELWGPQGKWTRFHDRLINIFTEKSLLDVPSSPGYYTLKGEASILKEQGFSGTRLDKSYVIVLPWTFSLTSLERLEKVIRQEF
jgi:hypothetical protein